MLKLTRFMNHPEFGTFGELHLDDNFLGFTVEQPWNNNLSFKSCVPHGTYKLETWHSEKHPDTFCLFNPANNVYVRKQPDPSSRYACLIHKANWAKDVQGCIGIGKDFTVSNMPMVTHSRDTTKKAIDIIKLHNIDTLHICWNDHVGE